MGESPMKEDCRRTSGEIETRQSVSPTELCQAAPTLEETPAWDMVPTVPAGDAVPVESGIRIRLTVTEGPHQGRQFSFEGHDTLLVGRSKRAHFRLPHKD